MMRTNVVRDDKLVGKATKLSRIKAKKSGCRNQVQVIDPNLETRKHKTFALKAELEC
jgi:hypothetical protein